MLGLIAGLTVPSIITSVQTTKTRTLQKETIQVILAVIADGVMNGSFSEITDYTIDSSTAPLVQFFTNKFNGKNCPKGQNAFPCNFNWVNQYPSWDNHSARWVLPNGVQVWFYPDVSYTNPQSILFSIDTDPNNNGRSVYGQPKGDQLHLLCNVQEQGLLPSLGGVIAQNPLKPGTCGGLSNWVNSVAQFNWIYQ